MTERKPLYWLRYRNIFYAAMLFFVSNVSPVIATETNRSTSYWQFSSWGGYEYVNTFIAGSSLVGNDLQSSGAMVNMNIEWLTARHDSVQYALGAFANLGKNVRTGINTRVIFLFKFIQPFIYIAVGYEYSKAFISFLKTNSVQKLQGNRTTHGMNSSIALGLAKPITEYLEAQLYLGFTANSSALLGSAKIDVANSSAVDIQTGSLGLLAGVGLGYKF